MSESGLSASDPTEAAAQVSGGAGAGAGPGSGGDDGRILSPRARTIVRVLKRGDDTPIEDIQDRHDCEEGTAHLIRAGYGLAGTRGIPWPIDALIGLSKLNADADDDEPEGGPDAETVMAEAEGGPEVT